MNENVWWKCLRWKFVRSVSTSRGRMRVNYACSFKCNITEFNGNLMSKTLSGPGSALTQVWIRQQMCVLSSATAFTYICYTYIYVTHTYICTYMYACVRGDIGQLPNHPIFGAFYMERRAYASGCVSG